MSANLTSVDILAAASEVLTTSGYTRIEERTPIDWRARDVRVFEDPFSIVAVAVYETWPALDSLWLETQAAFIELVSKSVTGSDPKAWEAYLVLFTPGTLTASERLAADTIRYDTDRTRKLVSGGDELKTLADVSRALLPLLPLAETGIQLGESAIARLPRLLEGQGVSRQAAEAIVTAFLDQAPLVEALHELPGSP
jgi:hypothetical protein